MKRRLAIEIVSPERSLELSGIGVAFFKLRGFGEAVVLPPSLPLLLLLLLPELDTPLRESLPLLSGIVADISVFLVLLTFGLEAAVFDFFGGFCCCCFLTVSVIVVRQKQFFAVNFFFGLAGGFVWDDAGGDADEERDVNDKFSFPDELPSVIKMHCGCDLSDEIMRFSFSAISAS